METDRINVKREERKTLFYPDQFNLILDAISEKLGKEFNISVDLEVRLSPHQETIKVINTIKEGKYNGEGRVPKSVIEKIKDSLYNSEKGKYYLISRVIEKYFEGEKINKFTVKILSSVYGFSFSESFSIFESDKLLQTKLDHLIKEIEYLKAKENGTVY